jgi:hypothetical protein
MGGGHPSEKLPAMFPWIVLLLFVLTSSLPKLSQIWILDQIRSPSATHPHSRLTSGMPKHSFGGGQVWVHVPDSLILFLVHLRNCRSIPSIGTQNKNHSPRPTSPLQPHKHKA